jgi:uncharacterized protein (TIGR02001 family)
MGRSRYLLVALALGAAQPALADEEFTANIGMMSDYIFRGVKQNTEASAFAGLDYGNSGFYVGTWAAEVGEGLEYDLYAGYNGTIGDFSYGIGYTGYFYTDDFDDTYQELNLSVGYSFITIDYAYGSYDNFDEKSLDYDFLSATLEYEGFYFTYGTWGKDFEGDYAEVGYGTEVGGFDVGIAAVYSDSDLAPGDSSETALMFTISKTFNLR